MHPSGSLCQPFQKSPDRLSLALNSWPDIVKTPHFYLYFYNLPVHIEHSKLATYLGHAMLSALQPSHLDSWHFPARQRKGTKSLPILAWSMKFTASGAGCAACLSHTHCNFQWSESACKVQHGMWIILNLSSDSGLIWSLTSFSDFSSLFLTYCCHHLCFCPLQKTFLELPQIVTFSCCISQKIQFFLSIPSIKISFFSHFFSL